MKVKHTLEPIYSKTSKTLILGSMPSRTSRELNKYYGNKYNRFWPIMEALYEEDASDWIDFIKRHNLALWDVIATCDIDASSDASIKNVLPNDIASLIRKTEIVNIFTLGNKAYDLYNKYLVNNVGIEAIPLPSTSSANARLSLDDLIERFHIIKELTEKAN